LVRTRYDQQLAIVDNTTPVREEISFHPLVGAVLPTRIRIGIAIYEIWLYNKLIMV